MIHFSESLGLVLFRSSDPSIWNTTPQKVQPGSRSILRIARREPAISGFRTVPGKSVIIPLEANEIGKENSNANRSFWWNGSNENAWGGRHLGIVNSSDTRSGVDLVGGNKVMRGWGFGHKNFHDDRQYYSWNGEEISQTVFEIAVKAGPLNFHRGKNAIEMTS